MTLVETMENLAEFLRETVSEYSSEQPSGKKPVAVYAGYPPVAISSEEGPSFIYALATDFTDAQEDPYGTVKVEIGFSVYDENKEDGWRSLFNLMEHVRQALLKHRCIAGRSSLVLPLKGAVSDSQPFPQWEGKITASYTIGQPTEVGIDYDGFWEKQADLCRAVSTACTADASSDIHRRVSGKGRRN